MNFRRARHIAYLTESGSEQHLWIHSLDQLTPRELVAGGLSREPFFSPDSTWLGFYDQTSSELKRVSVQGGSPLTIANVSGLLRGASWGDDDSIIFATLASDSGLWRVPASGGTPEQLSTPDPERGELDHLWPEILPGAGAVLFTITANPIEDSQIAVLSLETREHEVLVRGGSNPRYSPTGHLVYAADGALRVLRFDLGRLETTGDPVPVLEGVLTKVTGVADFSLSENGSLVYVPAGSVTRGRLVWVDRGGIRSPIEGEDVYGFPRLSPDGTRVALGIQSEEGGIDIRIRDFERGSDTRLTVQGTNIYPVWAPDGVTVTFASSRGAAYDLFSRPADLSGDTELLITTTATKIPGSWSPDGQVLVYYEVNPTTLRDIWMLPGDGDPAPFLVTPFNERAPRLSPDGRWMAYVSDQSGESNVYVQRFPDGGRVIPISTGGGSEAVWSRDGRALFYRSGSQMLAVEVDTTAVDLNVGRPSVIFEGTYDTDPFALGNANYDVSLDGERFLMVTGASAGAISELTVVQHWFEELKRLVPID